MRDDVAEVDVEVVVHGEKAVKVSNGNIEVWIPYSLIDEDSEVHERTPVGVTAALVIPEWKALELGLV